MADSVVSFVETLVELLSGEVAAPVASLPEDVAVSDVSLSENAVASDVALLEEVTLSVVPFPEVDSVVSFSDVFEVPSLEGVAASLVPMTEVDQRVSSNRPCGWTGRESSSRATIESGTEVP